MLNEQVQTDVLGPGAPPACVFRCMCIGWPAGDMPQRSTCITHHPHPCPADPDQPWTAEDGGALELYPQGKGEHPADVCWQACWLPACPAQDASWCAGGRCWTGAARVGSPGARAQPRSADGASLASLPVHRHPQRAGRGPHRHGAAAVEHHGLLQGAAGPLLPLHPGGGASPPSQPAAHWRLSHASCAARTRIVCPPPLRHRMPAPTPSQPHPCRRCLPRIGRA